MTKTIAERVIIIGGGAAGMLAAVSASEHGEKNVCVIEKNSYLGKKLNITGKGRCNVTNNCTVQEYLENVVSNPKFLTKAAYKFPPEKVMQFFESEGVELKTERGRRVFPVSDNAHDITECLRKAMISRGVKLIRGDVKHIITEDERVTGIEYISSEGKKTLFGDKVIIATGGMSYPGTGSDGSGYKLASELGHKIVTPRPSLVPLVTKEKWVHELTGLSLKNVNVTFKSGEKVLYSEQGEMLFTHFGLSGPIILSGSAYIKSFPCSIFIDMKPALTEEMLDARLLRDFEEIKNKDFVNSLEKLLPKAMIPAVAVMSGIDEHKKINSLTKEERRNLVKLLKNIPITAVSARPIDEAIVTAGGIDIKDINPSTMESKKVHGLYFCGEVIDVDCYTGGYNLQTAFCTGYLAGESAAQL